VGPTHLQPGSNPFNSWIKWVGGEPGWLTDWNPFWHLYVSFPSSSNTFVMEYQKYTFFNKNMISRWKIILLLVFQYRTRISAHTINWLKPNKWLVQQLLTKSFSSNCWIYQTTIYAEKASSLPLYFPFFFSPLLFLFYFSLFLFFYIFFNFFFFQLFFFHFFFSQLFLFNSLKENLRLRINFKNKNYLVIIMIKLNIN